jgi:hypothetical protein
LDNNAIVGYVLKADIRHYFDSVDHEILLKMITEKIKDEKVIWLIETILKNHKTIVPRKGMPLGNLTSQFFANLYLNEFDHFVKERLRARYYIRYVDDFVILHRDRAKLEQWRKEIATFLQERLGLEIHPEKSRIIPLKQGVTLLGFRIFAKYRLLKKSNARRIWKRLERFRQSYETGEYSRDEVVQSLDGWLTYAEFANTYNLRKRIIARFNELFGN